MSSKQRAIRTVLCDIGGVLHVGSQPIPGTMEALKKLWETCHRRNVAVRFLTNTDTISRVGLATRLRDEFGFGVHAPKVEDIFSAPMAARSLLLKEQLRPLLLITKEAYHDYQGVLGVKEKDDVHQSQDEELNAVVVADVGKQWSIDKLNRALRVLLKRDAQGKPTSKLIGLSRTRYYADDEGLVLDSGSFVKMLEYASGLEAEIVGKPSSAFFLSALTDTNCPSPSEAVMIGDDIETDVGAAQSIGIHGILVRTGKYRPTDETRADIKPDNVFDNFSAAVDWICSQLE